ncbi:MAG: tetratricopeptide repeat protein [Planctomycetota bacterium]|jgi:tetratricopeptide (TPR) repeat protein|nr:tetratricopeptide repeat protein [Planctomycetota bacterium]
MLVTAILSAMLAPQQQDTAPLLSIGDKADAEIAIDAPPADAPLLRQSATLTGSSPKTFTYRLQLEKAGPCHIEAHAALFDAYLILKDASGKVIAEDDNGWFRQHPRLVLDQLAAGKTYHLQVANHHGVGDRSFSVWLRAGSPKTMTAIAMARQSAQDVQSESEARSNFWSPAHPATFKCRQELAASLQQMGQHTEAMSTYIRLIYDAVKVFEDHESWLAQVLFETAQLHLETFDNKNVQALINRGLSILQATDKFGGSKHAFGLLVQGDLHVAEGRYADALTSYTRARDIAQGAHGTADVVSKCIEKQAQLARLQGRLDDAEELYQTLLSRRLTHLDPQHPIIAQSTGELACVYLDKGDLVRAATQAQTAFNHLTRNWDPTHLWAAEPLMVMSAVLRKNGNLPQAGDAALRGLRIVNQRLGANHPRAALHTRELAMVKLAKGEKQEGKKLLQKALAIQTNRLGSTHPQTQQTERLLAKQKKPADPKK